MIIVGDIGNTETKICLVNSKNKIVKRVTLVTRKINLSLLKKSITNLNLKNINSQILYLKQLRYLTNAHWALEI